MNSGRRYLDRFFQKLNSLNSRYIILTGHNHSSVKTWLHSILKDKVADYYRNKYKTPLNVSLDSYFDEVGNWKDGNNLLGTWDKATLTGDYDEFEHLLECCIEHLEPKWKLSIKLYYLHEKNTRNLSGNRYNNDKSMENTSARQITASRVS